MGWFSYRLCSSRQAVGNGGLPTSQNAPLCRPPSNHLLNNTFAPSSNWSPCELDSTLCSYEPQATFKIKWSCLLGPFSQGPHLKLRSFQREREGKRGLSFLLQFDHLFIASLLLIFGMTSVLFLKLCISLIYSIEVDSYTSQTDPPNTQVPTWHHM